MSYSKPFDELVATKTGLASGLAGLTTSYTAGNTGTTATTPAIGATSSAVVWMELATGGGTNVTSAEVKLQTSYNGTRWVDVACDSLDGLQPLTVDQTLAVSAGATVAHAFGTTNARLLNYVRVMVKATAGGALQATDIVTVRLLAGFI